jgi:ribosomal protein S18 acetylase RimI-like enzyme
MFPFPLIDQYLGIQFDMDLSALAPGEIGVVESERRLRCEQSYGYIHALFGIWFVDGRVALSVPPGARRGVLEVLVKAGISSPPFDPCLSQGLIAPVNRALQEAGRPPVRNILDARQFACNAASLRRWSHRECRRLRDESVPPAEGIGLPTHCFPDGIVYGIVEGDRVVSVAYAHRSGIMEDRVADLGVETAQAYRRRGFAKTVVSAVTAHITRHGGEALYNCSSGNTASMATARSVGYELHAKALILTATMPDRGS